jgi:hypothetical protein
MMFSTAQWVILRQKRIAIYNGTVRRAAAKDIEFKDRAARDSVWNGLLGASLCLLDPP